MELSPPGFFVNMCIMTRSTGTYEYELCQFQENSRLRQIQIAIGKFAEKTQHLSTACSPSVFSRSIRHLWLGNGENETECSKHWACCSTSMSCILQSSQVIVYINIDVPSGLKISNALSRVSQHWQTAIRPDYSVLCYSQFESKGLSRHHLDLSAPFFPCLKYRSNIFGTHLMPFSDKISSLNRPDVIHRIQSAHRVSHLMILAGATYSYVVTYAEQLR